MNENHLSKYRDSLIVPRRADPYNGTPYYNSFKGGTEDAAINFAYIWETLYRGKWIILAVCLLITGAATIYTLNIPPTYEATSIVSIDTRGTYLPGIQAPVEGRSVTTEAGVLTRSSELAERVAAKMIETADALGSRQYFPVLDTQAVSLDVPRELSVAAQISKRMRFVPVVDESMIFITSSSTSPEEAARIANLYAEEYKELSQETSRASIVAARTFLEEQVGLVQRELGSIENQYESFANSRQVVTLGQSGERIVAEYTELTTERDDRQFQLQKAQNERRLLEAELARIRPDLVGKVATGLQTEIEEIQQKIVDLRLRAEEYYRVNPSLRGNEDQIEEVKQIRDEIEHWKARADQLARQLTEQTLSSGTPTPGGELNLAASLTSRINEVDMEISRLQYEIDLLDDRIASYGGRLGNIPRQTIEGEQLQRKRSLVESWLQTYQTELQKYLVAEQSDLGYVNIVRPASVPIAPVSPNLPKNIVLAFMVGLLMGTGLVFVHRAVRQRLDKPEDVQAMGYKLIGVIPPMEPEIKATFEGRKEVEVDGKLMSTNLLSLLDPWSNVSENYRLVRTNLQHFKSDQTPKVLLVTSPEMSDGKTVNSVNIAITMAQSGSRTLLIDADVRRPNAHRLLGLNKSPGLGDILNAPGNSVPSFDHFATDIEGLYFVPAGISSTPPPELIGSQKMKYLLTKAREAFDVVVIDSPPVLAATDALLLATQADATIVVISAHRTEPRTLQAVQTMLEGVGVQVAGTLMNRFDSSQSGYQKYGYGYGYSNKYAYKPT